MPATPTTRMGLPAPVGTDPADVPSDLDLLRQRLDQLTAIFLQGAVSTRPTAGTQGRFFFATDERRLYYDDGQTWSYPVSPVGTMILSAAASAGTGWLLCDGTAYPRATYSALFTAIGTTWGAGDGSSTFNVPDLRNRVPVGVSATRALGAKGGEETHLLAASESGLPDHEHYLGQPAYTVQDYGGGGISQGMNGTTFVQTAGVLNGARNAQAAHNNMQPFAAINYFIKT